MLILHPPPNPLYSNHHQARHVYKSDSIWNWWKVFFIFPIFLSLQSTDVTATRASVWIVFFIHLPCWHSNFYKILGICLPNVYSSQEKLINTNKHEGGKNILIISN